MMDRSLKIVTCCGRYGMGGGAEYMVHKMHRVLQERGHDITVFAIAKGVVGKTTEDGIRVMRQPASYARELIVALNRLRPDVVLCQWIHFSPTLLRWAAEVNVPVVILAHNPGNWIEVAKAGMIEQVDLFVFNGPYLRDLAGCNVRQIIVTPPIEEDRVLAAKHDPKYVTLVNLCKDKGAEIFYALARRFPNKQFLGVIGGYNDQIKKKYRNVTILPHDKDMRPVYAQTRVLLMPSKMESYGMVGVEAQLNGIPVIAAQLPALQDSLGKGALFVKSTRSGAWATTLQKLDQASYYTRMAHRARENAMRNSFAQDMQEFEFVLQDLVRRRMDHAKPSVQGLLIEHAALCEYVRTVFLERVGRMPTQDEVTRVVESSGRPDQVLEALIREVRKPCTVRAIASA